MAVRRSAVLLCNDGELHAVVVEIVFVRCGKPRCRRCSGSPGHGPYAYARYKAAGHVRRDYIGKVEVT